MSAEPSPTLIGAFVLGALVLLVAGVLVLGADRWVGPADRFVIYFNESLRGLRLGAPVAYRGVEIGEVVSVTAILDPQTSQLRVPVEVRLRKDALILDGGGEPTPETMTALIAKGMRAQLQLESLVTGRLYVGLEFFPLQPAVYAEPGGQPPEIPSVGSPLSGVVRSLDEVAMTAPKLLSQATAVLAKIEEILGGAGGQSLGRGIQAASSLLVALEDPSGPLRQALGEVAPTVQALRSTAAGLDGLVGGLGKTVAVRDEQLGELLAELTRAAASIRRVADQTNGLVAQNRGNITEFTERGLPELTGLIEDANRMVNEFNGLVRDIRQNPARFLFGDPGREGVRLR